MNSAIGCTIVGIKSESLSGKVVIGSNSDNPWDTRTRLIVAKREQEYKFIGTELVCPDDSVPWANMITRGLNEKGLAYTFAYVEPTDGNYESVSGISFQAFSWHLLGRCANVLEAEQMVKSLKRAFHGNFLFADSTGNLKLMEISTKRVTVVDNTLAIIRCNHFLEMPDLTDQDAARSSNSLSRFKAASNALLSSPDEAIDRVKKVLASHDSRLSEESSWGHSPCNHGLEFGTVSSEIIVPSAGAFYFNFGWPCGQHEVQSGQLYQDKSWGEYRCYFVQDYEPGVIVDVSGMEVTGNEKK